jgi:hypothetical protein
MFLGILTNRSSAEIGTTAILTTLLAGVIYIVLVIGGAEYHYKRIGHPNSWKVFTWTIIIQLFVLLLPFFL